MEHTPLYDELTKMMNLLEPLQPWLKVQELIEELHDPKFAQENTHWWVRANGDFGSRKPLSLGMRSEHSSVDGRSMAAEVHYTYWPGEGKYAVRVRTKEDAIRIVAALMLHNLRVRYETLRIKAY
jgi:hypothetical protein